MAAPVTFVLVPGSFAVPEEHDILKAALEAKGQTVKYAALLSANDGSRMPPPTMEEDAEHIRSVVLEELDNANRNVVLVLHSYAGIPGTSALKGLSKNDRTAAGKSTAVTSVLYIASLVPEVGQSLRDYMSDYLQEPMKSGTPGEYLGAIDPAMLAFCFNELDPQEAAKYGHYFVKHSSDSYSGKCSYAAWKDIPSVQLIPEKDMIVPVEVQERMYQHAVDAGGKVKKVVLEGLGHCPNISRPEAVVKELLPLAQV